MNSYLGRLFKKFLTGLCIDAFLSSFWMSLAFFILYLVLIVFTDICFDITPAFENTVATAVACVIASIATVLTSYIFMHESNQAMKRNDTRLSLSIDRYGTLIKGVLTRLIVVSLFLVLLVVPMFLFCSDGRVSLPMKGCLDALVAASLTIMTFDFFVMLAVVRPLTVMKKMSLSRYAGTVMEYRDVQRHERKLQGNAKVMMLLRHDLGMFPIDDFTYVKEQVYKDFRFVIRDVESFTEYVSVFDRAVSNLLDQDVYEDINDKAVGRALVSGRKKIRRRLIAEIPRVIVEINASYELSGFLRKAMEEMLEFDEDCMDPVRFNFISGHIFLLVSDFERQLSSESCKRCETPDIRVRLYDGLEVSRIRFDEPFNIRLMWLLNYLIMYSILCEHYSNYLLRLQQGLDGDNCIEDSLVDTMVKAYHSMSLMGQLFYAHTRFSTVEPKSSKLSYTMLSYPLFPVVMKKMFFNKSMKGMDFSRSHIPNSSFFGTDLSGTDFSSARISGCDFTECVLHDCNWINAHISSAGALFNGAHLEGSTFGRMVLGKNVYLNDATFGNSSILSAEFDGTNMLSITLDNMAIHSTSFKGVSMDASAVTGTRIDKCMFVPENPTMELREYTCGFCRMVSGMTASGVPYDKEKVYRGCMPLYSRDVGYSSNGTNRFGAISNLILPYDSVEYELEYNMRDFDCEFYIEHGKKTVDLKIDNPGLHGCFRVVYGFATQFEKCCVLEGSLFEGSNMTNSKLFACNMRNMDFLDSSMFGTSAVGTVFDQSLFRNFDLGNTCSLRGVFAECSFRNCRFERINVTNTLFIKCIMYDSMFVDSRFVDVCLVFAKDVGGIMEPVKRSLKGSPYSLVHFSGCHLERTYLDLENSNYEFILFEDCIMNDVFIHTVLGDFGPFNLNDKDVFVYRTFRLLNRDG